MTNRPVLIPVESLAIKRRQVASRSFDIDVHLTNRCTLRCRHCAPDSGIRRMREHDEARLFDALARLVRVGGSSIHVGGGEPLLRRDLMFRLVAWGVERNLQTQVQTNGTLLKMSDIDRLFASGMDQLLFSLDGDRKSHDWFRQRDGNYEACMSAIRYCTSKSLPVRVNTVTSRATVDGLERLIDELRGTSVTTLTLMAMVPKGRGMDMRAAELSLSEQLVLRERIARYLVENQVTTPRVEFQDIVKTVEDIEREGPIRCRIFERSECMILSDGQVFPCFLLIDDPRNGEATDLHPERLGAVHPDGIESLSLGNIYEEHADEIWMNESRWSKYLRLVSQRRCAGEPHEVTRCSGGCPAYSYLVGSGGSCDTRCEVNSGPGLVPGCFCLRRSLNS